MNPHEPVNIVELIEDRGAAHGLIIEERIDDGTWNAVPADRIWADKPADRENPAPTVSAVAPATINVGSDSTSVSVTGANFLLSSSVQVNGAARPTVYDSDTRLTFGLPSSALATATNLAVTVTTPGPGGGTSAPRTIAVVNPVPNVTAITPSTIAAGSGPVVINLKGANFNNSTVLSVNGANLPTTFISENMVSGTIPAASLASPGELKISATNPAPGGGESSTVFTVGPRPAVPPSVAIADVGVFSGPPGARGIVAGQGFGDSQGTSIITLGGVPLGRALIWRDSKIEFKVPDLPAGTYPVQVIVNGTAVTIGSYVIAPIPAAGPIPNPVLLPGGGARVIFDASLSLNPDSGGTAQRLGQVNAFAVGISGISSVIWRFGDGTSSRQVSPSKTFHPPGFVQHQSHGHRQQRQIKHHHPAHHRARQAGQPACQLAAGQPVDSGPGRVRRRVGGASRRKQAYASEALGSAAQDWPSRGGRRSHRFDRAGRLQPPTERGARKSRSSLLDQRWKTLAGRAQRGRFW